MDTTGRICLGCMGMHRSNRRISKGLKIFFEREKVKGGKLLRMTYVDGRVARMG